jgi:hypothetical protein
MDGVIRQIRTSGRGSGSVEVTLPSQLRQFVGLPCRITLHEGERMAIIIEPDLGRAHAAFAAWWLCVAGAILGEGTPPFAARDFIFTLKPTPCQQNRAVLAWSDGWSLVQCDPTIETNSAVVARVIAAFAAVLAERLAIAPIHAPGFGAVCGLLVTGACPFAEWREPTEIAASVLVQRGNWHPGRASLATPTHDRSRSSRCNSDLAAAVDLFADWSTADENYQALSAAWRRGHSFEMNRG